MPRYILTLQPMPGDSRPDAVRLRNALKYLGRVCRLQCVGIRPEDSTYKRETAARPRENGCLSENGYSPNDKRKMD